MSALDTHQCVKCLGSDIYVVYHAAGCSDPKCSCAACTYGSHNKQHTEHLHLSCRRCQWDWIEPVAK